MENRNAICWCGSGLKYKRCHLDFDETLNQLKNKGYDVPDRTMIKNEAQIQGIRESAKINDALLDLIGAHIKAGMSTQDIDDMAHAFTIKMGATPATLNYEGFPKSICTSINDEVCHGIPSKDICLKEGDIINVDATTQYKGYYADASRMFMIGSVSDEAKTLVNVTKECLEIGIKAVKPWGFLGDIGAAIQEYAESKGYSVVKHFGGHGVGLAIHEDPPVDHYGKRGTGMILAPGMVFTIEPMINIGVDDVYIDETNGWTALTADGSLSAQWEHTILVTEDGIEILAR